MSKLIKLHDLAPTAGARRDRKRVGRGPGGTDKTSGRGHKGQKSRSGAGKGLFFEGGRSSLISRLPKRGFNNVGTVYEVVHLDAVAGLGLDTVERGDLEMAGLVRRRNRPVKLLASRGGEAAPLDRAITVHVDAASASAIKAIEEKGGKVDLLTAEIEKGE